ncbi:MAG: hypothetical protein RQ731_08065 [Anaerosomatales bacterium]|nr:hypothetical protein [Anaerosomatales bacterium]
MSRRALKAAAIASFAGFVLAIALLLDGASRGHAAQCFAAIVALSALSLTLVCTLELLTRPKNMQ